MSSPAGVSGRHWGWFLLLSWVLMVATIWLTAAPAAGATTYIIDDQQSSCSALPATTSWDAASEICWLEESFTLPSANRIEVEFGAQLRVRPGVVFATDGTLVVWSGGSLHVQGTWTNRGSARVAGIAYALDGGRILNQDEIWGSGALEVRDGGVLRSSTLLRNGEVRVNRGGDAILSGEAEVGRFTIGGYLENTAEGVIESNGTSLLDGTLRNDGTLDLTGATFQVRCGRIIGGGTLIGTTERRGCFNGNGDWRDTSNWNGGFRPNNSEPAYIEGHAVIVDGDSINRAASTFVAGGTLRVEDGGRLTNEGRLSSFSTNGRKLIVEGIVYNHDEIAINGLKVADGGGIVNWGTIEPGPGGFVNRGNVTNHVFGTVEARIENEAGSRFSNFGDLVVFAGGSENSGFLDIGPLGSLTMGSGFRQWGGAVLQNRGLLVMEGRSFAQLWISSGAVLHNTSGGTIEIVESGDLLRNDGNVQNDGQIVNDGRATNDGSWCGAGTIGPNGVAGTPPTTSCLPSFSVAATTPVDEGSTTAIGDTFLDPGANTDFEAEVVWGDGTSQALTLTRPSPVDLAFEVDHAFDDDGTYVVEVELCDPDGGCVSADQSVVVRNVPPMVVLTPPAPVDEGSVGVLRFTATDVGDDELSVSPGDVSCGTLAEYVHGSLTFDGTYGSFSCRYLDGPHRSLAGIDVHDDDGGTGFGRTHVTVVNVGPSITAVHAPPDPILVGDQVDVRAPFGDPGLDTHVAVWTWDDGSSSAGTVDDRVALGSHAYAAAGFYLPEVEVTDSDGAVDEETAADHVIVYDPDAGGLVVAGRWTTPLGAFISEPSRSAEVTVRAGALYRSSNLRPTGFVELRDGPNVLLAASDLAWLVVVGDQAWLAASATWEGAEGHQMLLAVKTVDDGPPLLRLRVIATDGRIVFDTDPGAPLDAPATVRLDRGRAAIGN